MKQAALVLALCTIASAEAKVIDLDLYGYRQVGAQAHRTDTYPR